MDLLHERCKPCEGGMPALQKPEAEILMRHVPHWKLSDDGRIISRTFTFDTFAQALARADAIGVIAEAEGHHPDLHVSWGKLSVELSTHSIGGLSQNDFILAAKIDAIG